MWHRAMAASDLWEDDLAAVDLGGRALMVVRLRGGALRVYDDRCPHQGTSLATGEFDGRILGCSAHAWTFDVATGKGVNPAGCSLVSFPVSIRDEQIFIELEQP